MMINTVLWMLGTTVSFCVMAVAARELTGQISVLQILLTRSVIGLVIITLIILYLKYFATDDRSLFTTHRFRLHLTRNIFHFVGQYGWVVGIGLLPLAEVFALEFTVPVWTALIAALVLSEQLTRRKLMAVALGFMGVLVIVKPGPGIFSSDAMIVLLAAIFYAVAHICNKSLASTEHPLTILFYMCLLQLPIGLLLSLTGSGLVLPMNTQWLWLLLIGLTALSGHFCLTKAMQSAEVSVVMTLDFVRLPMIAVIAVLLYGEVFDLAILIGGALILGGNQLNIWRPASQPVKATERQ